MSLFVPNEIYFSIINYDAELFQLHSHLLDCLNIHIVLYLLFNHYFLFFERSRGKDFCPFLIMIKVISCVSVVRLYVC